LRQAAYESREASNCSCVSDNCCCVCSWCLCASRSAYNNSNRASSRHRFSSLSNRHEQLWPRHSLVLVAHDWTTGFTSSRRVVGAGHDAARRLLWADGICQVIRMNCQDRRGRVAVVFAHLPRGQTGPRCSISRERKHQFLCRRRRVIVQG
jgi:hypothetical protein